MGNYGSRGAWKKLLGAPVMVQQAVFSTYPVEVPHGFSVSVKCSDDCAYPQYSTVMIDYRGMIRLKRHPVMGLRRAVPTSQSAVPEFRSQ